MGERRSALLGRAVLVYGAGRKDMCVPDRQRPVGVTPPPATNVTQPTRSAFARSLWAVLTFPDTVLRWVALLLIRFYQVAISPWTPPSCIYTPTCSAYGYEAIRKYGFFHGGVLTAWRILRCHPWAKGGEDPVP